MKKTEILDIAGRVSKDYEKKMVGKMMVSVHYDTGYQSGKWTDLGKSSHVFDYDRYDKNGVVYEQDEFDAFTLYIMYSGKKSGGVSKYNDCLWLCISKFKNGKSVPSGLQTGAELKRRLGLNRSDDVPLDLIPQVEAFYKLNINVSGDHIHASTKNFESTLELVLSNGHYMLKRNDDKFKVLMKGFSFKRRQLHTYFIDGRNIIITNYPEFLEMKKRTLKDSFYVKSSMAEFLKTDYETYRCDARELYEVSNGLIDLYKSESLVAASRSLFYELSHNTKDPEVVKQLEEAFLHTLGALRYAERNEYKNAIDYDVNSMYPYALIRICYPVKKGIHKLYSELPTPLEYGIYRVSIEKSSNEKINALFRFDDSTHLYTHYDIKNARQLGLTVTLIQDGNPNALIYPKESLEYGTKLFGPFVRMMFNLKKQNAPKAKAIINTLWGALCEHWKQSLCTKTEDEILEIPENCKILSIQPVGHHTKVTYAKHNGLFVTPYARIGPFVTSYYRYLIANIEHIKYIHTDGFIATKALSGIQISDALGKMKIAHEGNVTIENKNKFHWSP